MGKQWITALLISVNLLWLSISDFAYAKSEADWFYEAAGLEARFEKISSAQIPPNQKMDGYYKLLDDVRKFADVGVVSVVQVPSPAQMSEREARGRKAFSLLATGWIQQMLANSEAANKANAEYNKLLESMAEDEQAIARCFLERDYQRSPVCMPRTCSVEAKGLAVRVNAVDWPLRDLLQKMVEAVGAKITIPEEVNGLVDCSINDWKGIHAAIATFVPAKGLIMTDTIGNNGPLAPLRVRISDPLYMASIAERAHKQTDLAGLEKPKNGIETGCVLIRGHYIPAPYVVDVREKEGMVQVCINGVPVNSGHRLSPAVRKEVPPLDQAKSAREIGMAAGKRLGELEEQFGTAEAIKRLNGELARHAMVKSAVVNSDAKAINIKFQDGTDLEISLTGSVKTGNGEGRTDPAKYKQTIVRSANEQKDQIEDALNENSLVLISSAGRIICYKPQESERRLMAVCDQMQQIVRARESLCRALYDLDWSSDAYESAWEVMLNLRHRELLADINQSLEK